MAFNGLGTHLNCAALSDPETARFFVMLAAWVPAIIVAVITFQRVHHSLRAKVTNENQMAFVAFGSLAAAAAGFFAVWIVVLWLLRGFICPA